MVLLHAACWVHAERPLLRMVPYNEAHRAAIAAVRQQVWELYKDLKAYQGQPTPAWKAGLEARFDALCEQKTAYASINGVLKEMREHKADLLRGLERPEVPLHNNGTESIIRCYVKNAQDQRQHAQRRGSAMSGYLRQPEEDLSQTGDQFLVVSAGSAARPGPGCPPSRPDPAASRPKATCNC